MNRPYEYILSYQIYGSGGLSLESRGFRTKEDGTRQEFENNAFDGKDPRAVIELERTLYEMLRRTTPKEGSLTKIDIKITGDQSRE